MKTLSTEQQAALQELVEYAGSDNHLPSDIKAQFNYWAIDLKPKRVRKKVIDTVVEV